MSRLIARFSRAAIPSKITSFEWRSGGEHEWRSGSARAFFICTLVSSLLCACAPDKQRVILATTTSVEDSGLLDTLATSFNARHPQYVVAPVAAGTGMVLEIGRRKDADVLMTHDSAGEMQFVRDGYGYNRRYVMQNNFIIVGPPNDPAGLRRINALDAFRKLAANQVAFVSRADDSGTHRREMRLWKDAGVQPSGGWYLQAGVGMGDALLLAGQKRAYIMTDRATFIKFKPRINLDIIIDGDPPLLNKYAVINVRGASNDAGGRAFAEWLVSAEARKLISEFGVAQYGAPLFFIR